MTAAEVQSPLRRLLWQRDKKLYITCAVIGLVQLALRSVMKSRAAANFAVQYLVRPFHQLTGVISSILPFSLAEVCWIGLILFCLWYAVRTIWFLFVPPPRYAGIKVKKGTRPPDVEVTAGLRVSVLWRRLFGAFTIAFGIYTAFTLLWGLVYYTDTFEEKAGIDVQPVTVEELAATTRLFAEKVNAAAPLVKHVEPGKLTGDMDAIFAASDTLYDVLADTYSFLTEDDVQPKQISPFFSHIMSTIHYTGFFFPFTGEANLNIDAPECLVPSTIAHEIAHMHGIAPEQTANFVAVLACDTCGDPLYAYSGYLMGYIHLSNALYEASYDQWHEVASLLCTEANQDLRANNEYWQHFDSSVADTADSTYSAFLQSYDQPLGSKSYGAVVDLLVVYYGRAQA